MIKGLSGEVSICDEDGAAIRSFNNFCVLNLSRYPFDTAFEFLYEKNGAEISLPFDILQTTQNASCVESVVNSLHDSVCFFASGKARWARLSDLGFDQKDESEYTQEDIAAITSKAMTMFCPVHKVRAKLQSKGKR